MSAADPDIDLVGGIPDMLLWDHEMEGSQDLLADLAPGARLAVSVRALDWTIATLPEPIQSARVRDYLSSGLAACRAAVQANLDVVSVPDDFIAQYDEADEEADEPGASHFLSALIACLDSSDGVSPEAAFDVLSYCYEGSLDQLGIPEWTPEAESQNERCREVIAFQQQLLSEIAGA